MAKKLPKLTEVASQKLDADRAIDRQRQQLDELKEAGPGSASDTAAESSDGGLSVLPGPQKGTGLEGNPDVDDAKDDPSGSPELLDGTAVSARDRANALSPFEDNGPKPGDAVADRAGEKPDPNLVPGVTDAAANPLADAAGTGLRGTGSLTTPKADGVQAGPSAEANADSTFTELLVLATSVTSGVGKDNGDGTVTYDDLDGDGSVTVGKDFFVQESSTQQARTTKFDGAVVREQLFDDGHTTTTTTTFDDQGKAQNTILRTAPTRDEDGKTDGSITTTTTNPDGSSVSTTSAPTRDPNAEQPDENDNFVDRDLAQRLAPGQRPGDGDSDDNATDPVDSEIEFGTPTGPVPDLKGSLLGGDNVEPDFGGGGAPTSGPGNVDQTGAIDLGPDALDPLTGGREDDRNLSGNTVEQPPEEEGTDDTDSQSRDLVELRAAIADTPDLDTFALTPADDGND